MATHVGHQSEYSLDTHQRQNLGISIRDSPFKYPYLFLRLDSTDKYDLRGSSFCVVTCNLS